MGCLDKRLASFGRRLMCSRSMSAKGPGTGAAEIEGHAVEGDEYMFEPQVTTPYEVLV
jgi:hypothetical protein